MSKLPSIAAAVIAGMIATPASADSAVDSEAMIETMAETMAPKTYQAIDLPVGSFDLNRFRDASELGFMATMAAKFEPDYRAQTIGDPVKPTDGSGLIGLFLPEEYAFRSNEQNSGVDAVLPGEFFSNSTRRDYARDTGPAAYDKSSIGIRFGF